eukprot:TRINITY_DN597_c0_g3_i4.p1 TRINITY_DN597_c0_g3~~TRINITY_DN597_c0_g3_i4.p1  ORF type:complete len:280 (-),score=33.74 TRINITY_DN597_c0_g3_i4:931-1770(-)
MSPTSRMFRQYFIDKQWKKEHKSHCKFNENGIFCEKWFICYMHINCGHLLYLVDNVPGNNLGIYQQQSFENGGAQWKNALHSQGNIVDLADQGLRLMIRPKFCLLSSRSPRPYTFLGLNQFQWEDPIDGSRARQKKNENGNFLNVENDFVSSQGDEDFSIPVNNDGVEINFVSSQGDYLAKDHVSLPSTGSQFAFSQGKPFFSNFGTSCSSEDSRGTCWSDSDESESEYCNVKNEKPDFVLSIFGDSFGTVEDSRGTFWSAIEDLQSNFDGLDSFDFLG